VKGLASRLETYAFATRVSDVYLPCFHESSTITTNIQPVSFYTFGAGRRDQ
jgi:hypothetical protein